MPHFKTITVSTADGNCARPFKAKIKVDASGSFYCHIPEWFVDAAAGVFERNMMEHKCDTAKVFDRVFESLERKLRQAMVLYSEPEIETTHVIRYIIDSHVSFAVDDSGNVFPNAGYEGAEWPKGDTRFGSHHAASPSNGYSLSVGAAAYTKTVTKYAKKSVVGYEKYYAGGDHLGRDNPAERLNSWSGLTLGSHPEEMPYTDEAALFFHNLMMGMARLSLLVQDSTFEQEDLLGLISKGVALLGVDDE